MEGLMKISGILFRFLISVAFVFISITICFSQTATIYSENFEYSDGTVSSSKWSRVVEGCPVDADSWFRVKKKKMEAQDLDCEAVWISSIISTNNFTSINASVVVERGGKHEADDYIKVYYKLNGGSETLFTTNGENFDDFTKRTASTSIPNGSTVQIVIRVKNNDKGEQHKFDNVLVTGNSVFSVSPTVVHEACLGSNNGSISLNVTGGTAPRTYVWSNGATTQNISSLPGGNYTVTITDNNGINALFSYRVIAAKKGMQLQAFVSPKAGATNNGGINLQVIGGVKPYTYTWSNGATTQNISGLNTGNFSVTVSDTVGCTQTISATVFATNANRWTGASSTSWNIAANWSANVVPGSSDTVVIPSGTTRALSIANNNTANVGVLYVKTGASLTFSTNSNLNIYGNAVINGTVTQGTGNLTFLGTAEQNFSSANKLTFYNVIFNNSSSTGVVLGKSIIASNALSLQDGLVYTGCDTLFLTRNTANSLTGYSDTSFVVGCLNRASASNNNTYFFPVGEHDEIGKKLHLAAIKNNSLGGVANITTSFFDLPQTESTDISYSDDELDINILYNEGIWAIEPNAQPTSGSYDVRLYVNNFNGLEDNGFGIVKRDSGGSDEDWDNGNGNRPAKNALGRKKSDGYALLSDLTSFSEFGIGGNNGNIGEGLPISLISFTGQYIDAEKVVFLEWATATEINNEYFVIERSEDGEIFTEIIRVEGAGNSSAVLSYNAYDTKPLKGISYYRLRQVDYDGQFSYSPLISVTNFAKMANIREELRLFPNPSNGIIKLFLPTSHNQVDINIIDWKGNVVKAITATNDSPTFYLNLDLRNELMPGSYLVKVSTADFSSVKKLQIINSINN